MARKVKTGAIVTAVVSVAAIAAIGATFMANASPYVNVRQAMSNKGTNMHLAGDILKQTVKQDALGRSITFTLKDQTGQTIEVDYSGEAIANMDEATRVVAIGGVQGEKFVAHKMLIKCPSKYDATPKGGYSVGIG